MHDSSPEYLGPKEGARVSRRDLLKMTLGAGLVVVVGGCSSSTTPAAQPTSAPAAPATQPAAAPASPAAQATAAPAVAAPKPSGTLTVAIGSIGSPTYTPARMNNEAMFIGVSSFGESLLDKNDDLTVRPQLAEKWSISPDGKVMTFDLRKGIKFHDGTELTAADVKWTYEEAQRPDSTNVSPGEFRDTVERIETPTPYQVVFYLKERNVALPYKMAGPNYETQIMVSKANVDKLGEDAAGAKPIGTGPYKFVEFKPGESVRFEAVENHWRQSPPFKELVYVQVPEESTRVAMVLRGEADLTPLSISQLKRVQDGGANAFVDKFSHSTWITLGGQYLPSRETFDPTVPWVADPADKQAWERARKVREAMNIAVDRPTIVDTLFQGQAEPATYLYAIPGGPFSDPAWKTPYDPTRAKQLLAEAGYADGFEFPLLLVDSSARPGTVPIGEAVGQYWQAIGLRPKLQKVDYTGSVRPGVFARTLSGIAYSWAGFAPPEPVVSHLGGFGSNAGGTHGPEYPPLDDLIAKALSTGDFEERRKIELQMGQMVLDEWMVVPIAWLHGLWGGSKKIKSWPRIPGLNGAYNFEHIVPA